MDKIIKILMITSIFSYVAFGLFGPIYAIYVQEIGGSILEASGAMGIFAIVVGVVTIFLGKIGDDKHLKKKLIVIGYFLGAISTLGYYFVRNPLQLFIVQIFLGLAEALINPNWDALFSKHVKKDKEATEWGIWEGSKQIAVGIASITGGIVVVIFGFKTLILIMFLFESLAAINVSRLIWKKKFL